MSDPIPTARQQKRLDRLDEEERREIVRQARKDAIINGLAVIGGIVVVRLGLDLLHEYQNRRQEPLTKE